ncbi:MAG: sensor histidine kinase [Bacillota bacterium]
MNTPGFLPSNGRNSIVRSVTEALAQIEQCAELAGDNQQVQALLDSVCDKLRRTVRELRQEESPLGSVLLDSRDLKGSLERLTLYARQVLGAPLESFIDENIGQALTTAQATHVLQVVQEALCNAVLHAGASRMALRAEVEQNRLVVRISDDGRGFDVKRARRLFQGGLATMQQRVDAARGLLQVESAPGAGSIITLTVPLRGREHRQRA